MKQDKELGMVLLTIFCFSLLAIGMSGYVLQKTNNYYDECISSHVEENSFTLGEKYTKRDSSCPSGECYYVVSNIHSNNTICDKYVVVRNVK